MKENVRQTYTLNGGGSVTVLKPFGNEIYGAVIEQRGLYPGAGKIARNSGRNEFVYVLEGAFTISRNGEETILKKGESLPIPDGTRYSIEGAGSALVLVKDEPGGKTEIEKE